MERSFRISRFGAQLFGREKADTIWPILTRQIESADPGDVLALDWTNVEVCDVSFGQALVGRLLRERPRSFPGLFILSFSLGEYARLNLTHALSSERLMHLIRSDGSYEILGKTHPADLRTFQALQEAGGEATAPELAHKLCIKLTAMNQRLSKLQSQGFVQRRGDVTEAGRETFMYWTFSTE
jgi:DNA-binding MarR family transcriptional regulator